MHLAIVGGAQSYKHVPRDSHVWCVATVYQRLRHADLVFELHEPQRWPEWLPDVPACIAQPHRLIPNARILPAKELVGKFGPSFKCSIAWMIGLALLDGYTDIGMYGVDAQEGYSYQRDSVAFMLGAARGMGSPIYIPEDSMMHLGYQLYGDVRL